MNSKSNAIPSAQMAPLEKGTHQTPAAPQSITSIDSFTSAPAPKFSQEWLVTAAHAMNKINPNPEKTLSQLKAMAQSLTDSDRDILFQTAVDQKSSQNQRALAVHLLTLSKDTPVELFIRIASFDDPAYHEDSPADSTAEYQKQFANALALLALDQIQERASTSPALIGELESISERSASPLIRDVARRMAIAVRNGKSIATN